MGGARGGEGGYILVAQHDYATAIDLLVPIVETSCSPRCQIASGVSPFPSHSSPPLLRSFRRTRALVKLLQMYVAFWKREFLEKERGRERRDEGSSKVEANERKGDIEREKVGEGGWSRASGTVGWRPWWWCVR